MVQIPILANFCLLPTFLRSFTNITCTNEQETSMHLPSLALTGLATAAAVTNLYVSSYSGDVTTLHLSALSKGGYSLTTSSTNPSCSLSPTWLTKDEKNGIIYCLDEGIYTPNGSITSFKTSQNGTLTKLDRLTTINGPVSSVIFNNGQGMAAAY